jgi:hypothetical protein
VEASDDDPLPNLEELLVEAGVLQRAKRFPAASFTPADILRWRRIIQAIERKEGPIRHPQRFSEKPLPMRYPDCDYHLAFPRRIRNLQQRNGESHTIDGGLEIFSGFLGAIANLNRLSKMEPQSRLMTALLTFMPVVYGGIHLTALHLDFPSLVESKLWFASSIYTMAALPVWTMAGMLSNVFGTGRLKLQDWAKAILSLVTALIFAAALLGYALARMYLVVESFISLRLQPIGVYWTPSWLQMIPHI